MRSEPQGERATEYCIYKKSWVGMEPILNTHAGPNPPILHAILSPISANTQALNPTLTILNTQHHHYTPILYAILKTPFEYGPTQFFGPLGRPSVQATQRAGAALAHFFGSGGCPPPCAQRLGLMAAQGGRAVTRPRRATALALVARGFKHRPAAPPSTTSTRAPSLKVPWSPPGRSSARAAPQPAPRAPKRAQRN